MLVEFSKKVQLLTEELDREVKNPEIFNAFIAEYQLQNGPYVLKDYDLLQGRDADQARCCPADGQRSADRH